MALSRDAELLLLIIAANGGEMTSDDTKREWMRVKKMSHEEFVRWHATARDLARYHRQRILKEEP